MTQKTAVEFMVEELNKSIGLTNFVDTCDNDYKQEILGIIEKAKAIEKEQKIDAFNDAIYCNTIGNEINYEDGERYYNETFK